MNPRRRVAAALAVSALPLLVGVVAVRPASALPSAAQTVGATAGYDQYSLTGLAAGARTAGDVGAGGGLATLDTGAGSVTARLDAAPSAAVLAAPYEPGTLARTVVGQVNAGAGEAVLDVPDAEAQFPGAQTESELATVPPADGGPASSRGGSATAKAGERLARGTATGERLDVGGAVVIEGSTSSVELTVDPVAGTATATGRSAVGTVTVAGVLVLKDVVATASVKAVGDTHTPVAALTVGGATVAGQPVEISDEGVTAVGTPVLPGQTVQDLTDRANAALVAAGVQVSAIGVTTSSDARGASADTGGVTITLRTAALPAGVPANSLDIVLGGVALTESDARAVAAVEVPVSTAVPPVSAPTGGGATTFVPGSPGTPGTAGIPGVAPPQAPTTAAAPVVAAAPATFTVVGRRLAATTVLAAFAVWQFLSLGTATLYAVVDRRRRQTLGLS